MKVRSNYQAGNSYYKYRGGVETLYSTLPFPPIQWTCNTSAAVQRNDTLVGDKLSSMTFIAGVWHQEPQNHSFGGCKEVHVPFIGAFTIVATRGTFLEKI